MKDSQIKPQYQLAYLVQNIYLLNDSVVRHKQTCEHTFQMRCHFDSWCHRDALCDGAELKKMSSVIQENECHQNSAKRLYIDMYNKLSKISI